MIYGTATNTRCNVPVMTKRREPGHPALFYLFLNSSDERHRLNSFIDLYVLVHSPPPSPIELLRHQLFPFVVHESPPAADIRFVNFDGAFHLLTVQEIDWLAAPVGETFPNTLQQEPRSRLRDFQLSTTFVEATPFGFVTSI